MKPMQNYFRFSKHEIIDLCKAWFALSIAFGILFTGGKFSSNFLIYFLISAFTVGTAFLLHELAHKFVAQNYGCHAEFKSFDSMLIFAIVMSFFGFVFAAPGAVFISGPIGKRREGKISSAGIAMNLLLGVLFLIGNLIYPNIIFKYGMFINALLALFNLLPFWTFDGKKVLEWNKIAWGIMAAVGAGLMISYYVL